MKKLIALVFVALSVLGMAVGQKIDSLDDMPEWVTHPSTYGKRVYGGDDKYMYFVGMSREFTNGRSTAKKFAEQDFKLHFLKRLYGETTFENMAGDVAQERSKAQKKRLQDKGVNINDLPTGDGIVDLDDLEDFVDETTKDGLADFGQMISAYRESFEKASFTDYEFKDYYYAITEEDGMLGYFCAVLGRVPKKAVSELLISVDKKAEKIFKRNAGYSVADMPDNVKNIIEDIRKHMEVAVNREED